MNFSKRGVAPSKNPWIMAVVAFRYFNFCFGALVDEILVNLTFTFGKFSFLFILLLYWHLPSIGYLSQTAWPLSWRLLTLDLYSIDAFQSFNHLAKAHMENGRNPSRPVP
jgi:hypothetical protein